MAKALQAADSAVVLLGNIATAHPQYSLVRALAEVIATASGATLGMLPEAANTVGGWLAGVLPHRGPAGAAAGKPRDERPRDAGTAARGLPAVRRGTGA